MPSSNRSVVTPKFVVGVFLVLMGVVLTLDQLGVVQANHVLRFWPAALIIIGFVILQRGEKRSAIRALILIVVGGWLLLNTLGLVSVQLWEFIWPLVLVLIGARIMMRNQGSNSNAPPGQPATGPAVGATPADPAVASATDSPSNPANPANPPNAGDTHATLFALLGSSKRRWGKAVFRSAEATAVMGGCELDLRDALITSGEPAHVDVFVIMGGVNLYVPPNWTVALEVVPLLGGVHDKTRSMPSNPGQHLIVRGTVVMGGIEICN
jgi:predicted membrane protein